MYLCSKSNSHFVEKIILKDEIQIFFTKYVSLVLKVNINLERKQTFGELGNLVILSFTSSRYIHQFTENLSVAQSCNTKNIFPSTHYFALVH